MWFVVEPKVNRDPKKINTKTWMHEIISVESKYGYYYVNVSPFVTQASK